MAQVCLTCEQPFALEVVAHAQQGVVDRVHLPVADCLDALVIAHVPELQAHKHAVAGGEARHLWLRTSMSCRHMPSVQVQGGRRTDG